MLQEYHTANGNKIVNPSGHFLFAANFNNFGNIYMITQGGPARVDNQFAGYTDILASTTYKMTTWSNRYELSATFSVLIFIIVGTFTLVNMHLSGSFKEVD